MRTNDKTGLPAEALPVIFNNYCGVALEREIAMTKSELVRKLAETNPGLYHHDVEAIVTLIFEQIDAALARGDRVELRGFGSFSVKHRGPRIGRNPRNG